jgi:hypothetical protein
MKKREGVVFGIVFIAILFIAIYLVNAETNSIEKNIFKKVGENIRNSYLKITGNSVAFTGEATGGCTQNEVCKVGNCDGINKCINGVYAGCVKNNPSCGSSGSYCGDGSCNNGESCSSCSADCGKCPSNPSCTCENKKCGASDGCMGEGKCYGPCDNGKVCNNLYECVIPKGCNDPDSTFTPEGYLNTESYYVKTTVTSKDSSGKLTELTDKCYSETSKSLIEGYCNNLGNVVPSTRPCPYNKPYCKDGACVDYICGDGKCSVGTNESCITCPIDCGKCPCTNPEVCNDFNSCTKDDCSPTEPVTCSYSCSTTGKVSGVPGTWGAVFQEFKGKYSDIIFSDSEILNNFILKNIDNSKIINPKNKEKINEIILNDYEMQAGIIFNSFINQNRLVYIIIYEGDKPASEFHKKMLSKFIENVKSVASKKYLIPYIINSNEDLLKPLILTIDISCKDSQKKDVFNLMQKSRNMANSDTLPTPSSMSMGYRIWISKLKVVAKSVFLKLKIYSSGAGKEFPKGLDDSTAYYTIAAYTNFVGNIWVFTPSSNENAINYEMLYMFDKKSIYDIDSNIDSYTIAGISIGQGLLKNINIKDALDRKFEKKLVELKSAVTPKKSKCPVIK